MELPFYCEASEVNLFLLVILTEPNQSKLGSHFFMDIVAIVNGGINVRLGLMFAPQSVTNFKKWCSDIAVLIFSKNISLINSCVLYLSEPVITLAVIFMESYTSRRNVGM